MARQAPSTAEKIVLSPEDALLADLFTFRRSFNKDGSIRYVQVIGDQMALEAFAENRPVRFKSDPMARHKLIALPRLIMQRMLGRPLLPEELVVPENGKNGDCRRSNLRLTDRSELARNERDSTWSETGTKYVYSADNGRYYAKYQNVYLGTYDDVGSASKAVQRYQELIGVGMSSEEAAMRLRAASRNVDRIVIRE